MRYRVIVADPPWAFADSLGSRGADAKYGTLTIDEIADLPVREVAREDSALFLWFAASMISDACRVVDSWGFRQVQIWTWDKRTATGKRHFGMGRLGRGATEHLLVGVRGKINSYRQAGNIRTIFSAVVPRTNGKVIHSRKPERLQDLVEKLLPGPYLELFARRERPGWACLGNECPGDKRDIRDSLSAIV